MKQIKKIAVLVCALAFAASLCACSGAPRQADTDTDTTSEETITEITEAPEEEEDTADVASWEWETYVLDCYDYDPYYLEFAFPSEFQKSGYDESGMQTRNFWYAPDGEDVNASDYNISICFQQGGYGPHLEYLSEDMVEGTYEEKELGGATVHVGLMAEEEGIEPNGFNYMYYMTYDEDDYARIWFIVHDREEEGLFRQMFEDSLNFIKE